MADWLLCLGGGLLAVSGALIGYFAFAYNYFKGELKEDDPSYRTRAAAWLTSHALLAAYRDKLKGALAWLQRWMGNPLSPRALGVCITISMVYSIVFFIASWTAAGPGTVGWVVLLPRLAWWQQAFWGSLLLLWLLGVLVFALFRERTERALEGRRWHLTAGAAAAASILLFTTVRFFAAVDAPLAVKVAAFVAVFVLGISAVSPVGFGAAIGIGAGAVVGAVALAGALWAVLWAVLVLVSGPVWGSGRLISLVLFFSILPIANALLDWPSWWVSRRLGQHLLTIVSGKGTLGQNPGRISRPTGIGAALLVHVLIDLGAAVACLWGLAVLLPFLIELFIFGPKLMAFPSHWRCGRSSIRPCSSPGRMRCG